MKNNAVNPNRLKEGVIYKYTRRYLGDEYWEFLGKHKRYGHGSYTFKQVYGNHYRNGTVDWFDSIDLAFYTFYTNEKDRTLLLAKVL